MIYLLDWERSTQTLLHFEKFKSLKNAWKRFSELDKLQQYVFLLEASSEKQLRETHGRYFIGEK